MQPPTDVADLLERGGRLRASGFTAEAYRVFLRAYEAAPHDPKVQVRVADFLLSRGELDEAQRLFSLAASAGHVGGLCGLVELRERRGQLDAAWGLIERVPDAIEGSLAVRLVASRVLSRLGRDAEAVALLQAVDLGALDDRDAAGVLYALGDLHDGRGEPERAFAAWKRANRRRGLLFDRAAHLRDVDAAIGGEATFDASLPIGDPSVRPVFIVGVPRSGTSLVEQILSAHPDVFGGGELPEINALWFATDRTCAQQVEQAAQSYLQRIALLDRGTARVTDKMPFNALRLGFIAQLFPNAHIIHCTRDPADTALSIFGRNFSDWHTYAASLRDIAQYIAGHERVMAHWRDVLPMPICEVGYEDLTRRGEDAMREIVAHVGLHWDASVLEFHRSTRAVATASYAQVQQPLYTSAIGRAGRYSKQLRAFRAALASARGQSASASKAA